MSSKSKGSVLLTMLPREEKSVPVCPECAGKLKPEYQLLGCFCSH